VKDMNLMFFNATSFNQPLNSWDVKSVKNRKNMFKQATSFKQNLASWRTKNPFSRVKPKTKEELQDLIKNLKPLEQIDVSAIKDMSYLFCEVPIPSDFANVIGLDKITPPTYGAKEYKNLQGLETWDVSNVKNMRGMFQGTSHSLKGIEKWDVSNVKNMSWIFADCYTNFYFSFSLRNNPGEIDLSNWDVSNVETMSWMFKEAASFNQPLNSWNVGKVKKMNGMFAKALTFNQPLNKWDVSNVENMQGMFYDAKSFNQTLNSWDIAKVKNMSLMFYDAKNLDLDLIDWKLDSKIYTYKMFNTQEKIQALKEKEKPTQKTKYLPNNKAELIALLNNPQIKFYEIDVSKITDMSFLFCKANMQKCKNNASFRENFAGIESWDVSNVENMEGMFFENRIFNQSIREWDVSNVKNMREMFYGAVSFDQDLSTWDVSNVKDMSFMFFRAVFFDQDLSSRKTPNLEKWQDIFTRSPLENNKNKQFQIKGQK
ncbi:DUF285 domain-containing protein, partial [Helicobacter sp. faydin-H17]